MTSERASSVLDASALLAYLHREPGNVVVETALVECAIMNACNYAEVMSRVGYSGQNPSALHRSLLDRGITGNLLQIVPMTEDDALAVGRLRPLTRHLGLSLGDRACLATGLRLALPVLTADRRWVDATIGVPIKLIRP